MIEHGGVWLPDGEQHMLEWMTTCNERVRGVLTYQYRKLARALELTHGRDCVVDVGAHCGLWSMHLAHEFASVIAFEPVKAHVDCLMRNCTGVRNVQVYECALGNEKGFVSMHHNPSSSGDTYPMPDARTGGTPLLRYDDMNIGSKVDLVKLDCEGYELFALQGMQAMLERDRPTVVVEQKPHRAVKYGLSETQAVTWLESLGARLVCRMSGDYFVSWA